MYNTERLAEPLEVWKRQVDNEKSSACILRERGVFMNVLHLVHVYVLRRENY